MALVPLAVEWIRQVLWVSCCECNNCDVDQQADEDQEDHQAEYVSARSSLLRSLSVSIVQVLSSIVRVLLLVLVFTSHQRSVHLF